MTETLDTGTGQHPETGNTVGSRRGPGLLLLVGGLVGLVAAVVLLVEKIAMIENPDYIPTCNINPVLACGSVMTTPQASAFGIPNPIIGVAGFAIIATIGAAVLAGAKYARWFWLATQAGVTFAIVFVHWLIYQSLYVIGALCPYCMAVWAVTIPIFWYVTTANVQLSAPRWKLTKLVSEFRGAILTAWYLIIVALIAQRFWDYWTTLV